MRAKGCLRYAHGFAPFHGDTEQTEDRRGRIARDLQRRCLRLYPRKTRIVKTRELAEGPGFALPPPEPAPPAELPGVPESAQGSSW